MKRRWGYVVMGWCALTSSSQLSAKTFEAFGDSVTAGFFSGTSILRAPSWLVLNAISARLLLARATGRRGLLTGLHAPELAWPQVLAKQLSGEEKFTLHNAAVSGAITANLVSQIESVPEAEDAEAFFFIGHNDLCARGDTVDEFADLYEKLYREAYAKWDERHKNSRANFLPIADIHRVYETLEKVTGQPVADEARPYTCYLAWEASFPYCRFYAQRQREGTLGEYLKPRIDEANRRLERIAGQYSEPNARGNRARALIDVGRGEYETKFFALDCFHLSADGQGAMAARIAKAFLP